MAPDGDGRDWMYQAILDLLDKTATAAGQGHAPSADEGVRAAAITLTDAIDASIAEKIGAAQHEHREADPHLYPTDAPTEKVEDE